MIWWELVLLCPEAEKSVDRIIFLYAAIEIKQTYYKIYVARQSLRHTSVCYIRPLERWTLHKLMAKRGHGFVPPRMVELFS